MRASNENVLPDIESVDIGDTLLSPSTHIIVK
jgi:hypothetical protein